MVYPGNPQGRHPNEPGARGRVSRRGGRRRRRPPGLQVRGYCAVGADPAGNLTYGDGAGPD